eukprot:scaffold400103_cov35-Prasinocladus_malaysianus.AAC.1
MEEAQQALDDSWASQEPPSEPGEERHWGHSRSPSMEPTATNENRLSPQQKAEDAPEDAQSNNEIGGSEAPHQQKHQDLSLSHGQQTEEDEAPIILITTVDIGGGRSDRIQVRAGENTLDVARRFCESHSLPEE